MRKNDTWLDACELAKMRRRGSLAISGVKLRAVLGSPASNPVLQVLGVGAYPAVLPEDCVVPPVQHNGPWGGWKGRGGPVPYPRQ
jgi:hypothetical protein